MTINHFFPDLFQHMRELEDCRKKSDYELAELITACIAMSMFMQGSRCALNNAAEEGEFKENYEKLFKYAHYPYGYSGQCHAQAE